MTVSESDKTPSRTGRRAAIALVAGAAALALVGCGSDKSTSDSGASPATASPIATAPSATTPPADATPAIGTQPQGPDAVTTTPESQQGGAGDETGVRVQASLLLDNNKVVPTVVKLPAFLPIELVVVSVEGLDRRLTIDTRNGAKKTFKVPALAHRTFDLPGLPKGLHQVYIDGKPQAQLDIGGEPAP